MSFAELLEIVGDEPVFETGLLLAGDVAPADLIQPRSSERRTAPWLPFILI